MLFRAHSPDFSTPVSPVRPFALVIKKVSSCERTQRKRGLVFKSWTQNGKNEGEWGGIRREENVSKASEASEA